MGLAARRGPEGCQVPPSSPTEKKGKERKGRQFLTTVDSVFLSGGAGFLRKVSLCVLTDTQERSQPRSSLALLRNRSGPGRGGEGQRWEPSGRRGIGTWSIFQEEKNLPKCTHFAHSGGRGREGAVTLEPENQQIFLDPPPHL